MLSDKIFNYGIDLLEQNHDRKLAPAIKPIWREYLNEHLSDVEFVTAVKHSILHSRFMPTASDLVEHINGGKESRAIQEWQSILKASARSTDESQLAYISTRARVALQSIGGLAAVGLADQYERPRMEKSFITVYCQCSSKDSKSLPQASTKPTQEADNTPPESSPMPEDVRAKLEALQGKFAMDGKKKKKDSDTETETTPVTALV